MWARVLVVACKRGVPCSRALSSFNALPPPAAPVEPKAKVSVLLARIVALCKEGSVDGKSAIDELFDLKTAHPEVEEAVDAGIGACCLLLTAARCDGAHVPTCVCGWWVVCLCV